VRSLFAENKMRFARAEQLDFYVYNTPHLQPHRLASGIHRFNSDVLHDSFFMVLKQNE